MKRLLTSIPVWIILADMIYGFALNVSQSFGTRRAVPIPSDGLPITPDIAFDSLQIISNGGIILIIGFGLTVLLQLNRSVLKKQILPIGVFRTLGLLSVLAFSIPSLWEWFWALLQLAQGKNVINPNNLRYFLSAVSLPLVGLLVPYRLYGWYSLSAAAPSHEEDT